MRNIPSAKGPPYFNAIRGPNYTWHNRFNDLGNTLILNHDTFWAFSDVNFAADQFPPVEVKHPNLAAAAALTQTAMSSSCERTIWPDYKKPHPHDVDIKQYPTLTNAVLSNLAMARAIDIWEGNKREFNDDHSTAKTAAIADAIAKMSASADQTLKDRADLLAETWLGRYSLDAGAISTPNLGLAGTPARFFSPIELIDMSQELPSMYYLGGSNQLNMLKDFELDFNCSKQIQPALAEQILADAFKRFETYLSFDSDDTPFRHRDILVQAQTKKIHLPYIAAEQQLKEANIYEGTLLSPSKWEKSLFRNGKGCWEVNLDDHPAGFFSDILMKAFSVSCLKLTWSHDEAKPLSIDVRTPDEGADPAKTLDSIRTYQDMRRLTGITTRLVQSHDGKATSGLKSYLSVTENFMRDIGGAKTDEKETRLYFHNVAKDFVSTQDLNLELTITTPKTQANITAVDFKKGKKRTDPAIERRAPSLPKELYTSATIDLQSADEYANPKLILTFSHSSSFNDIYEDIARVQADALTDLSSAGGSGFESRGNESATQERADNVKSLLEKMMQLQKKAQNEKFGESIHVVIEAPAPDFGYTGVINDVLISVNWQDKDGNPGEVESIGPADVASSPFHEVYLNNGSLSISKFSPELFIASFSGVLTDDPILPPTGPRIPHKDRIITGNASGTLVIAMPDLGLEEDREIASDILENDLMFNSERLSSPNAYLPDRRPSNDSSDRRSASTGSSSGGAGPINPYGKPEACDCSCDTYWGGVDSGQGYSSSPSKACLHYCAKDYLICRSNPPESMQPKQKSSIVQGEQRRTEYADQIEYYAKSIGLTTPEMIEVYADGIVNASDDEVRQLLEIVRKMREEGPKK